MEKNIAWFRENFIPLINDEYKLEFSFFENGDFGNLERIELEGKGKGGTVDFWNSGWLNIHLVDYTKGIELINILLEPNQTEEKERAFKELKKLMQL